MRRGHADRALIRPEAYAGKVSTSQEAPRALAFHLDDQDMRAIVESLPILIVIVDLDRKIRFYNGRDETAPQVLGRDALDFMPPEDREAAASMMAAVLSTGEPVTYEMRVTDLKGELRWFEVHVGPLRHGGEVIALAFASIDITERKRVERMKRESDEKLAALVATLPGLVMTIDRDLRVTWVNRYEGGFTPEQVLGVSALAFVAPDFQEIARRAFDEALQTGKPARYETEGYSSEDMTKPAHYAVHVGPVLIDGEVQSLTLTTEDITERKRLEVELRTTVLRLKGYAEELEEKNRLLAAENAERERTELLLRQQREVVTALSTPIIQAWEGVLALPIVGALDCARATQLMEKLLAEIVRTRARFTVLDLTGVEAVDVETAGHLHRIVRAASLLGSRCLVSGISPSVAQTMVSTGAGGAGGEAALMTFGQMQDAIRYALERESAR